MKQFEATARVNNWSDKEKTVNLTIVLADLQTIPVEETDDFDQLKKRLNMRYGSEHLEHLYRFQLKNWKCDETFQYELDSTD